jgi:hypothetical protein
MMLKDFTIVVLSDAEEEENFNEVRMGIAPWLGN